MIPSSIRAWRRSLVRSAAVVVTGATAASAARAQGTPPGSDAVRASDVAARARRDSAVIALDYTDARVGEVPRRLRVLDGSVQAADVDGRRWVRLMGGPANSRFQVGLDRRLPPRFTLTTEVRVVSSPDTSAGFAIVLGTNRGASSSRSAAQFDFRFAEHGALRASGSGATTAWGDASGAWFTRVIPLRVVGEGATVALWVGEERVCNVERRAPDADGREDALEISVGAVARSEVLVGPLRFVTDTAPRPSRIPPRGAAGR